MKKMSKHGLLTLSLTTLLVAAACGNENNGNDDANTEENNAETQNNTEVNEVESNNETEMDNEAMEDGDPEEAMEFMDQDPEEPVAVVNGEEITSGELQGQLAQFETMFAQQEMEEEETAMMMMQFQQQFLDQLINQTILAQEAEEEGFEADEEEVEAEIEEIRAQFETEEQFEEALDSQGYSEEDLEEEIRQVSVVEQLLTMEHLDEEEYEVEEEEVREYYEMAAANDPEMADSEFEDVQEDLEEQLRQNQYVEELRDNADVEILL
ncbi:MAG: hypothetical protein EA344_11165 [Alkalicoccus sp.]|nr:MAG: hypothetical protein EA344_11165 [Alkalicoccus sp.]